MEDVTNPAGLPSFNVCRMFISSLILQIYESDFAKYLPLSGRGIKMNPVATNISETIHI
jgi:hypothetical protein